MLMAEKSPLRPITPKNETRRFMVFSGRPSVTNISIGGLMHDDDKIPLGAKVKDRLTGFAGVLMGRTEYLYASETVLVQAEDMLDGKPGPSVWFDSGRIQRLEVENPLPVPEAKKEAE